MPDEVAQIPKNRGKKNRPLDSRWRQQSLSAFRPVLTIGTAFPWTFVLGIIFVGLGIAFHFASLAANEIEINYTNCIDQNGRRASEFAIRYEKGKICTYDITLDEDFTGTVKLFYSLDQFFQNNKYYVMNRNDFQLLGDLTNVDGCGPLDYGIRNETTERLPYAPCGKMADSFFNDTYTLHYHLHNQSIQVPLTTKGMLHRFDKEKKYSNPKLEESQTLCDAFQNTLKPPNWPMEVCEFGSDETGWGLENIDFQIWMKIAALPKFRKVYRVVEQIDLFANGLPKGNYTIEIEYNYPVNEFNIQKLIVIAVESWMGPRNFFLGIAYMAVGIGLVLLSAVFFVVWLMRRYKSNI